MYTQTISTFRHAPPSLRSISCHRDTSTRDWEYKTAFTRFTECKCECFSALESSLLNGDGDRVLLLTVVYGKHILPDPMVFVLHSHGMHNKLNAKERA